MKAMEIIATKEATKQELMAMLICYILSPCTSDTEARRVMESEEPNATNDNAGAVATPVAVEKHNAAN
jgi:hypothetical protein